MTVTHLEGQPDGVQGFCRPTHHREGDHKLPDVHRVVFILLRKRQDGKFNDITHKQQLISEKMEEATKVTDI